MRALRLHSTSFLSRSSLPSFLVLLVNCPLFPSSIELSSRAFRALAFISSPSQLAFAIDACSSGWWQRFQLLPDLSEPWRPTEGRGTCFRFSSSSDKPLASQVNMAEWNPEKDLLATVTEDSTVVLHRFNWQRLWTISPVEIAIDGELDEYRGTVLENLNEKTTLNGGLGVLHKTEE